MGPVERQAAASAALLEHLHADGEEAVTNVRVASDAREVQRRFAEANKNKGYLVIHYILCYTHRYERYADAGGNTS